jgi:hypothetical protein
VKVLRMKTVGPTTNTKNASSAAAAAFAFDRYLMPRSTPETAEITKHKVRTAITTTARVLLPPPSPNTSSMPPVICSAPRPSDVAEPNRVAKIATTSMALPGPSDARRPNSGRNVAEIVLP